MTDPKDPATKENEDLNLDDLDGLDGDGFERELADARASAAGEGGDETPYTQEEVGLRSKLGWGRSPIISVAVIVVGLFLLVATWADFAYFLRVVQGEPRELGTVADIYQRGAFTERFDNEWVHLEAEPDVQHAARMQSRDQWIGFLRVVGADASLFVGVPRVGEKVNNQFPGEFTGRMRRLDRAPRWDKIKEFFTAEELIDIVDLVPESVVEAVAAGSRDREVETAERGATELGDDELVRVLVRLPVGLAQLGRETWKTQAEAEGAISALGAPYAFVERRSMVWVFAVAVGDDPDVEVFQKLTRRLNGGDDLVGADPKKGGLVLPRRATYLAHAGDLLVESGMLSFTYGDNTAETGWVVEGARLEPIVLEAGRLSVPVDAIEELRVERMLNIDPKGYLLMVDQAPADVWPSALMFGAVLGVVLLNLWALLTTLRRRRAGEVQAAAA